MGTTFGAGGVRPTERAYGYRELALEPALRAGTCHIGSALGIADVLAVAYFSVMDDDDTFILSKAHAGSALMATLALADGRSRAAADRVLPGRGGLRRPRRALRGGRGDQRRPLGHGLAIAVGRSLADRLDGRARRTFCLMGDGEPDEGSSREGRRLAGRLDWIASSDHRRQRHQGLESTTCRPLGTLRGSLRCVRLDVAEIDGHDQRPSARRCRPPAAAARASSWRTRSRAASELHRGPVDSHYKSIRPQIASASWMRWRRGRIAA